MFLYLYGHNVKVHFRQGVREGVGGWGRTLSHSNYWNDLFDFKLERQRFTLHPWCCIVTLGIRVVLLQCMVASGTFPLLFGDGNVSLLLSHVHGMLESLYFSGWNTKDFSVPIYRMWDWFYCLEWWFFVSCYWREVTVMRKKRCSTFAMYLLYSTLYLMKVVSASLFLKIVYQYKVSVSLLDVYCTMCWCHLQVRNLPLCSCSLKTNIVFPGKK